MTFDASKRTFDFDLTISNFNLLQLFEMALLKTEIFPGAKLITTSGMSASSS